jgi:hypothetical protein
VQTAAEESKRQVEQTGERLLTAESERDALVAALKEQQDSWATKPEVRLRCFIKCSISFNNVTIDIYVNIDIDVCISIGNHSTAAQTVDIVFQPFGFRRGRCSASRDEADLYAVPEQRLPLRAAGAG